MVVNKRQLSYIGRPGAYGNPFEIGRDGNREAVIAKYRAWIWLPAQLGLRNRMRTELKGQLLVCFCAPHACHGDVIENEILSTPMEVR